MRRTGVQRYFSYHLVLSTPDGEWKVAELRTRGALDAVRELERCGRILADGVQARWGGVKAGAKGLGRGT